MDVLGYAIILATPLLMFLVIRAPWNELPPPMVVLGMLLLAVAGLVWAYQLSPG